MGFLDKIKGLLQGKEGGAGGIAGFLKGNDPEKGLSGLFKRLKGEEESGVDEWGYSNVNTLDSYTGEGVVKDASIQNQFNQPDEEGGDPMSSASIGAMGDIAGGLGNIVSGIVGGGQRRREQTTAREEYRTQLEGFKNMDYYGTVMANPWEDMTVNQLQADFQARQSQQGLANTMAQLGAAAGGSGVAGLAQSLSNQQTQDMAQISANIGQQESRNQQLIGQGEYYRSLAVEKAEKRVRDKNETLLVLSAQRRAIADQARKDATAALTSGIGSTIGGVGKFVAGGGFGG